MNDTVPKTLILRPPWRRRVLSSELWSPCGQRPAPAYAGDRPRHRVHHPRGLLPAEDRTRQRVLHHADQHLFSRHRSARSATIFFTTSRCHKRCALGPHTRTMSLLHRRCILSCATRAICTQYCAHIGLVLMHAFCQHLCIAMRGREYEARRNRRMRTWLAVHAFPTRRATQSHSHALARANHSWPAD